MLYTSADILNITLSISIGLLSVFLVIFLVYLIIAMKRANKILGELSKVVKVIDFIKDKIEHSTSHLGLLAEAVKRIVMHFIEGKIEIKTGSKSKKKK